MSALRYGTVTVTILDEREAPGDELIHTCAEHPFLGQVCRPDCRAFCGYVWDDDVPDICDDVSPDHCVVCETMCDARYGTAR